MLVANKLQPLALDYRLESECGELGPRNQTIFSSFERFPELVSLAK
jgi:hypothetical protein